MTHKCSYTFVRCGAFEACLERACPSPPQVTYLSWEEMAAYRGALVVPQDLNLLKFTEFYAMAVPPPPPPLGECMDCPVRDVARKMERHQGLKI